MARGWAWGLKIDRSKVAGGVGTGSRLAPRPAGKL